MKIPELREEIQGRPASKFKFDMAERSSIITANPTGLSDFATWLLYLNQAVIDGGNLGDTADAMVGAYIGYADDGMTDALDMFYRDLDGGTLG